MVSVTGAQTAISLVEQYNAVQAAIAAAQGAIAANYAITDMACRVDPGDGGNLIPMDAQIPFNAADSATIFNDLITIWNNQLTAITGQLEAIS